jgi:heterodisulfide reductase subunit C/nitrate reductase gamma subunit
MDDIKRETMWNITSGQTIFFYILATMTMILFIHGFYRRFRLWRKGVKEKVQWKDVKANFRYFFTMAVEQKKIKRDRLMGFMHRFTSYGFVILFIGTVLVFIDYDLNIPILQGSFYLVYEAVLDFFGVLFIIGILLAMYVRAKKKRVRLRQSMKDNAFLWLLLIISIGGYILEAIRIKETQIAHGNWSPVGYTLAKWIEESVIFNAETYFYWWISHAILAFILIVMIPYSKLFHFISAPINILFQPVKRTGKISLPYDLTEMNEEDLYQISRVQGVNQIQDFTSWQLFSTDVCTECGRCDSQCPAHNSLKPLSPRNIVLKIRDHMHKNDKISAFISPEELQSCTTCGACVEACPVSINHIDLILSMRRGLVQNQVLEREAESTLIKTEDQYNIWGKPWSERAKWVEGTNIKVNDLSQMKDGGNQ